MEELIKSLSSLSIDNANENDINLLCENLSKIKVDDKEELSLQINKLDLPKEVKQIIFNFFEILEKKKRCFIENEIVFNKSIY